jgi:hypothetical protein
VSFEHAKFRSDSKQVFVSSVSERGSTFVGGRPLTFGGEAEVPLIESFVQIGNFLLEVRVLDQTIPVSRAMPLPINWREPLLEVRERRGRGRVVLAGDELPIPPKLFRLLLGLATRANEPVTRDELIDVIEPDGWVNLDPLIHRLRATLEQFLADRPAALKVLGPEHQAAAANSEVGKALIETVRGRGYRLTIPSNLVSIHSRN